jgi:hypothetical protein
MRHPLRVKPCKLTNLFRNQPLTRIAAPQQMLTFLKLWRRYGLDPSQAYIDDRAMGIVNAKPFAAPQGHAFFTIGPHRCDWGSSPWIRWLTTSRFFPTATALLIAFQFVAPVDAVNLKVCGARLQEEQNAAWNATHHTEPPPLLLFSYEQCSAECGPGMGDIDWENFSGNVGAWLLPWIALMFQIPFSAERKLHYFAFASR